MRYLYFRSVRGDLQEGSGCASRCQSQSPRAQNRAFCALLPFETPIFGHFEHKIEVFVSEWAIFPRFWVVLTQNRGFCAREGPTATEDPVAEDPAAEDSAAEDPAAEDSAAEEGPDAAG